MPAVPEDLMAKLRQATEQLDQARIRTNDIDRMDTAQRRDMAAALRAAEKQVEEVTEQIHAFLATGKEP